ncbi:PE-PGRS family protein [Archangium violaceum]|uniref:PE-PGRS family protein n=1 Tax=Archangium violaceum TaxID=83451 RepID=UPI0037BE371F
MHETKKLFAVGAGVALLTAVGCYNFQEAYDDCVATGRCAPEGCKPEWADPPDDRFLDSNCDGIDGVVEDGVFVDPVNGKNSAQSGTKDAPYQTLAYALERIPANIQAIYLARGVYNEPGLRLDKPISLYGGYAGLDGGWKRDATHITQLKGGSIGLTVNGLGEDAGVSLEWLSITSTPGSEPSAPSIGLRVLQSKGVRLRHVQIQAEEGADGAVGSTPSTGPGGADGGTGGAAPSNVAGGSPGISSCGSVQNKGGTGGRGGENILATRGAGARGEAGTPSASGGDGGLGKETPTSCTGEACHCVGEPGQDGQVGAGGGIGPSGDPGDGIGTLVADTWSPTSGTAGQPGYPGGGGGGGGGGGMCSAKYGASIAEGSGGGGGGAGGCPGLGGSGGKGGGASIALLLINAHVELESCSLKTTKGGEGGAGGPGGPGGPGGQGGPGGPSFVNTSDSSATATGGRGGKGGNGGKGGDGGPGGNGGGGPSVGIWCGPDGSVSQTGTTFTLGPAGKAGKGLATQGHDGIQEQYHGCEPTP